MDKVRTRYAVLNSKSKKKPYQQILDDMLNIDNRLRDFLLQKYIERCQRVHALAFFQWRAQFSPGSDRDMLIDLYHAMIGFIRQTYGKSTKLFRQLSLAEDER